MLLGQSFGESAKRMTFFVRMMIALSLACSHWCSAEGENQSLWALEVKSRPDPLKAKSDDGKNAAKETPIGNKKRRSISESDRTNIVMMMNNLRRTAGSSNMPYMAYNVASESDAASWTQGCNYDNERSIPNTTFGLKYITIGNATLPDILRESFKAYRREMSSVYLTSFGCDENKCNVLLAKGSLYKDARLILCLFQGGSQFDQEKVQFKLGEGCTECDSGSFWCDYGLCRDDCSASDSNCYCNSYCLNCADTDRTTCRCQCLEGWTGSRCETDRANATKPSCTTTARFPRVITTIDSKSVASTTIDSKSLVATTMIRNNMVHIEMSVSQFILCAVMAFLLRQ